MMNSIIRTLIILSLCLGVFSNLSFGQDTLYRADLQNQYFQGNYSESSGTASIIQAGDSFQLYFHEDFDVPDAPDVHIFLTKECEDSETGSNLNNSIDFYTFPDGGVTPIKGEYTFAISKELVDAIDTLPYIIFECVRFGNILFGCGEWQEFNPDSTGTVDTTSTSIESLELDRALSIYPIPANDILNISLTDHVRLSSIRIINMNGQVVLEKTTRKTFIDISSLAVGSYLAQFKSTVGGIVNRKFVISR